MFDFHEKRKIKGVLYSKPVIICLFMFAGILSFTVYDRYIVAEEMYAKLEAKRTELRELESRAQLLESKVEYLKDERGVEEELRNRFDVAKQGEQVVIIVEDPEKRATSTQPSIQTDAELPNEDRGWFAKLFKSE